jgi:hypothetical protein
VKKELGFEGLKGGRREKKGLFFLGFFLLAEIEWLLQRGD